MPTRPTRTEDHETPVATTDAPRIVPRASIMVRQRNRMFGLALASVALLMFIMIVMITVLVHLDEAHHALTKF